nr:hypothetical protein [Tanacetum cinerariifolium]
MIQEPKETITTKTTSSQQPQVQDKDGWKPKALKNKSFAEIQELFDKAMKRINTFVDFRTELVEESTKKDKAETVQESSSKRTGDDLEQERSKKQKMENDKESVELKKCLEIIPDNGDEVTIDATPLSSNSKRAGEKLEQKSAKRQKLEKEDDSAKLKRCLKIVSEDDYDVTIKATPLSSKFPTIVDYKINKEGKKNYFKIIRADGNSQSYLTFGMMFKNFNREDLEVLWSIVKERFKKTKPVDDMDSLLFQTMKTMFEHHAEDNI